MRKTVHLCLSSHDEIMYRSEEDLNMGFNCLALAVLETESRLLAEGFMTTHHHNLVQTDRYKELMYRSRYAYARYFNAKYSRTGQLGEKKVLLSGGGRTAPHDCSPQLCAPARTPSWSDFNTVRISALFGKRFLPKGTRKAG